MNRRAVLWFAVAGPIAAWTAQLLLAYFLVSLACAKGIALPVLSHGVSLVAASVAAAALIAVLRARSNVAPGHAFVAQVASLAAGLFLVGIIFGELSLLFARGCV